MAKLAQRARGFRDLSAKTSALLLLAVLLAAYWPALHGEFLLDDDVHVPRPEQRSLSGLARIWTDIGATQQYYPVLHTAFWLQHRLWGDAPLGYHLANVLLHAGAAWLLVAIMRQLELPGAWLAGGVFALHPVAVESVAWIAEQKNTLSTVFYLAAALAYLRFDRARSAAGRQSGGAPSRRPAAAAPGDARTDLKTGTPPAGSVLARYLLATALFALALGSKTATATLPAALLVILWWRHGRLGWRRDVVPLLPWFAAGALAGLVTIAVERQLIAEFPDAFDLTGIERCLLAGRAVWFYLLKLLWPANLVFFYERWDVDAAVWWQWLPSAALLAVAIGLVVLAGRPEERLRAAARAALAALLLYVGTLAPVLGFFDVEWFVFSFVADHLQYLASAGVIAAASAGLVTAAALTTQGLRQIAFLAAGLLLGVLGLLTRHHSGHFADNVSLYRHAAVLVPSSPLAQNHLGVALARIPGREQEAMAAFTTALRLNPAAAEAHENLADVLRRVPGRLGEAVSHYEAALRLKPARVPRHYAGTQFDFARELARLPGRESEAIAAYEAALRLDPRMAEAQYNLGNLLLRRPERLPEAVAHFEAALRLKPDFAEAHANLGTALAGLPGRLPEAIAHFEAALRLKPDFTAARNNLQRARQLLDSAGGTPR